MIQLAPSSRMRSSNLAIALWCLPRERRKDALFFYSFCRAVDDIADNVEMLTAEKLQRLDEWDAALATGTGLPEELAAVMHRHELSPALLREIVAGCRRDVSDTPIVYETFEELRDYCWQVAGAVGVAAARIFGAHSAQVRQYAEHLGLALQLTNIVRDVREDAEMRRVYLPAECFGVRWIATALAPASLSNAKRDIRDPRDKKDESAIKSLVSLEAGASSLSESGAHTVCSCLPHALQIADILALHDTPALRLVLERLADTAKNEFARAEKILPTLPASEVMALRPARLMAALYSSLLEQIHRRNYDTMLRRPSLSWWRKLAIVLGTPEEPK